MNLQLKKMHKERISRLNKRVLKIDKDVVVNQEEVVNHEVININSRVRDIILLDKKNILCVFETNSTLGLLKFEN